MNELRMFSLYSGSSGNAFVISAPCGTILIDAGKNAKQLCRALSEAGVDPSSIGAILLTHEHNDHIGALAVFLKKHPVPVYLPTGCAYKLENDPVIAPRLLPHPPIYTETVCGMTVTSFPTPHDSRASVGYRIEIPCGEDTLRLGYATDVGYVTREIEESLLGCECVVLESNHDPEMLENGPYRDDLKKRIASRHGHLSNGESASLAARLCNAGTRSLMLAHLSAENNEPEIAYDECFSAVGSMDVRICLARPDAITELATVPNTRSSSREVAL